MFRKFQFFLKAGNKIIILYKKRVFFDHKQNGTTKWFWSVL